MQNLINNSYKFELVDDNHEHYKYDFLSIGETALEIPKRVSIRTINYNGFYNLGFGNFSIQEDGTEIVDDRSRNINKANADTILNTALLCGAHFLSSTTDTTLIFYGNTLAKHRLYKIKICNRFNELSEYFIIKGGVLSNNLKFDSDGFKIGVDGKVNPDDVQIEDFNIANSRNYNFLTFEIRS